MLHLGSFSKTISAALRVGFIAGPAETIRHLTDLKLATTFGNNQISAQAVHRLLDDGSYRKQVAAVRERLRRATPPLRKKLEALGLRVWTENAEGMFLWMELPEGAGDAAHLAARAIERASPHLAANGRQLIVKLPPHAGDWNDLLREIRSL